MVCLRLRLDFSFLTSGDDSSLIGYWRVAGGFGFLDAAPYSPIPDLGRIPVPITHFLYLPAAASVMWKQFSQQLKSMQIESRTCCSYKGASSEHAWRGEQSSTNLLVPASLPIFPRMTSGLSREDGFVRRGIRQHPLHQPGWPVSSSLGGGLG